MTLYPVSKAAPELLELFHTKKESVLAHCYEPDPGVFIAESAKVTQRALQAGFSPMALLVDESQPDPDAGLLSSLPDDIPVYSASSRQFLEISGYPMTRGLLCAFRRRPLPSVSRLLQELTGCSASEQHLSVCSASEQRLSVCSASEQRLSVCSASEQHLSDCNRSAQNLTDCSASAQELTARRRSAQNLTDCSAPAQELTACRRDPLPAPASQPGQPAVSGRGKNPENLRIALLDNINNPANIGSIFRNAAALNIDAVLLADGCCDPLARRSIRVSMGTVFCLPWTLTSASGPEIIREMQTYGFSSAALALTDKSISIDDPLLSGCRRLALLLGNEGNGLSQETILACDYTVKIPMREGVDSLNVASASAVAFWAVKG